MTMSCFFEPGHTAQPGFSGKVQQFFAAFLFKDLHLERLGSPDLDRRHETGLRPWFDAYRHGVGRFYLHRVRRHQRLLFRRGFRR